MKGIYLAACKARHPSFDIDYNDIDPRYKPDICSDMLTVDLSNYDFIVASPPCNFWTRSNYRFYRSRYALRTMHLLPSILLDLAELGKPFLVENVINYKRMSAAGIFRLASFYCLNVQRVGRHIYFSNVAVNLDCKQHKDFDYGGYRVNSDGYNEGGSNVHAVVELWLDYVVNGNGIALIC